MSWEQIKKRIGALLETGEIRCFLGYRSGTTPFAARPLLATRPEELNQAVFSPLCVGNLLRILIEERKRTLKRGESHDQRPVALVVKGCDARAVNVLIQEHILKRNEVLLVGMPCRGVVDPARTRALWSERSKNKTLDRVLVNEAGLFEQHGDAEPVKLCELEEMLAPQCRVCTHPNPVDCDEWIWDKVEEPAPGSGERYAPVETLLALDSDRRLQFWREHFSRCIRCNACKNICPLCYCDECTLAKDREQTVAPEEKARKTAWIDKEIHASNNMAFHMHRALHLAGRCVDCGECERACPVGIPLRWLYTGVERSVSRRFGYEAGITVDEPPVLAAFSEMDGEDFVEKEFRARECIPAEEGPEAGNRSVHGMP